MLLGEARRSTPKPKYWIHDLPERQAFGKVRHVGWKRPATSEEQVLVRASQMQHVVAMGVRRLAADLQAGGDGDWSLPALAQRLETVNYDGLMRVMRGDVHMTLLHCVDLSVALGHELLHVNLKDHRS